MDKNHPTFIIAIEKKLTNLLKEIKASETILEIDYKKLKAIVLVVLEFYMACAKLRKRSLANIRHINLSYQQVKLSLTI